MVYLRKPIDDEEDEDMEEVEEMPKLTLSFDDLPEAESWEDGETYEITVRQVSHNKKSATFEIVEAGSEEEVEAEEENED